MQTLQYLEKIESRSHSWTTYINKRSTEVQKHIDRLRFFANCSPGKVREFCTTQANDLQERLNKVINS